MCCPVCSNGLYRGTPEGSVYCVGTCPACCEGSPRERVDMGNVAEGGGAGAASAREHGLLTCTASRLMNPRQACLKRLTLRVDEVLRVHLVLVHLWLRMDGRHVTLFSLHVGAAREILERVVVHNCSHQRLGRARIDARGRAKAGERERDGGRRTAERRVEVFFESAREGRFGEVLEARSRRERGVHFFSDSPPIALYGGSALCTCIAPGGSDRGARGRERHDGMMRRWERRCLTHDDDDGDDRPP
jgi:hypothetical protein